MQNLYLMLRKLIEDVRRLWKHAALVGVVLAVICPLLPARFTAPCDALLTLCSMRKP